MFYHLGYGGKSIEKAGLFADFNGKGDVECHCCRLWDVLQLSFSEDGSRRKNNYMKCFRMVTDLERLVHFINHLRTWTKRETNWNSYWFPLFFEKIMLLKSGYERWASFRTGFGHREAAKMVSFFLSNPFDHWSSI